MNNDNFLIEDSDLELARTICAEITDDSVRNRSVANVLAAEVTQKYFEEIEVDTESGLHRIPFVLNVLDISDVYLKDSYIDVRVYFNDNELCVPKSHFDSDLLPVAYMFIKLESNLAGGLVTGFITPSAVDTSIDYNGYYRVSEEDLTSYYDIEPLLENNYDVDFPNELEIQIYDYLDSRITNPNEFYKTLLGNRNARKFLKNAANVKTIFNFVSLNTSDTAERSATLDINNDLSDSAISEDSLIEPSEDLSLIEVATDDMLEQFEDNVESFELESETDLSIDGNMEPLEAFESNEFDLIEENNSIDMLEENDTTLGISFDDNAGSLEETDSIMMPIEEDDSIGFSESQENDSLDVIEDISLDLADNILQSEPNEIELSTEDSLVDVVEENDAEENIVENIEIATDSLVVDEFENDTTMANEDVEEQVSGFETPSDELEEFVLDNSTIQEEAAPEDDFIFDSVAVETQNDLPADIENGAEPEEIKQATETYSTTVTPSIESIDNDDMDNLEQMLDNDKSVFDQNDEIDSKDAVLEPQINDLFGDNNESQEAIEETFVQPVKQKKSSVLPLFGALTVLIALGYFGYTKFSDSIPFLTTKSEPISNTVVNKPVPPKKPPVQEAMPLETVENIKTAQPSNEGIAVSIPAIEQNLDASIVVSNLTVNWEVPSGYANNATATRYLTKLGKIIRLNLKTELLLISKSPITNKIMLELEFDKNDGKFKIVDIIASSGEALVDDVIKQTVNSALNLNLKTNISSFANIQGNPVLVIRL